MTNSEKAGLKYALFHSLSIFVVAYLCYFHDALSLLWQYEHTRVSFLIMGIYVMCSLYLGWKGIGANFKAVNFQRMELTGIGLLGTIVGLGLMTMGAGDVEAFKASVISNLSSIFLPSGFGMLFSILLGQQISLVFGRDE